MGMKANNGFFSGTKESLKYKLDIQMFSSGEMPLQWRVLYKVATNTALRNTIKELYRPGTKAGNGSTATAIRRELKTGILVGGKSHLIKGRERMRRSEKLLDYGNLSKKDTMIAKKLYNDLKKAFGD